MNSKLPKHVKRIIIDKEEIHTRIRNMVENELNLDYKDKTPVIVGVLKGCYMFLAAMSEYINFKHEVDFVTVSSFGGETERSKGLKLIMDVNIDLHDRHVLICDDVHDLGKTTLFLKKHFELQKPKSVKVVVFADKKAPEYLKECYTDYKCIDVENIFLLGFGLDYKENYRNLPYLAEFNFDAIDKD